MIIRAYEVHCPSIPDMSLDEQVRAGCNDWRVDLEGGYVAFGRTAEEAELEASWWAYCEGQIDREGLRRIVNAACTCGGRGPNDSLACPACLGWHRVTTE